MQHREHYLEQLDRIRGEINRLFESALMTAAPEAGGVAPPGLWLPAVDVVADERGYRIFVELPGVVPEAVQVSVDGRRVDIAGERRLPMGESTRFRRMESRYGPFRRAVELDRELDAPSVATRFERGVLEVDVKARS